MLRRTFRNLFIAPMGLVLLAAIACGSPASPSSPTLSVAGSWAGTAELPNPYSATMSLQQTGSAVSGTMRIAGATAQVPVTGTVNSGDRTFTWRANYNCEVWSGVLTIAGSAGTMNGPLTYDRSGCTPALSNGSGTLSLNKQ